MLQAQSTIANSATSALANIGVADKYAAASRYAAELGLTGVTYSADVHAAAQRYTSDNAVLSSEIMSTAQKWAAQYSADNSKAATVLAASLSYSASKYGIDKRTLTDKELAEFNADVNKELKNSA